MIHFAESERFAHGGAEEEAMALFFDIWEDLSVPQGIGNDFHLQLLGIGYRHGSGILANDGPNDSQIKAMHSRSEDQPDLPPVGDTLATGGGIAEPMASDGGTIVVTGQLVHKYVLPDWWYASGGSSGDGGWIDGGFGGSGTGGTGTELPDDASIDVQVNIDRPLSATEQEAINNLKSAIERITAAINALADNAVLTLPNGADVTGAELKALWAKVDFVINDNATYQNGGGGEASMYFSQPTISFNVQYLNAYDDTPGGMNYLVAHELGHLSQAGDPFLYTDQRTANDIARALLNGADLAYLDNPGHGYTSTAPMEFSVPSTGEETGGDSTGGGSAGSGGNTYDTPIP